MGANATGVVVASTLAGPASYQSCRIVPPPGSTGGACRFASGTQATATISGTLLAGRSGSFVLRAQVGAGASAGGSITDTVTR